MHCGIKNPRGLKVRRYTARLIGLNKYLAVFPGGKICEKNYDRSRKKIVKQYAQQLEQARICSGILLWIHYF